MRNHTALDSVSIVMPAHNSGKVLADAVESVIAQTFEKWELLIVDDASTDGTLGIARRFADSDSRIRVIQLKEKAGVAAARNAAIAAAKGRYLAFLDSDDLWLPRKLEEQLAFMARTRAAFSFTQYRRFTAEGVLLRPVEIRERVVYKDLLKGNMIGCLTVVIDLTAVPAFTMPDVGHEDFATWLAILKRGHVARGLKRDLARYRISETSISAYKTRSATWTWSIYRRLENLSLAKALWYFAHYSMQALRKRSL